MEPGAQDSCGAESSFDSVMNMWRLFSDDKTFLSLIGGSVTLEGVRHFVERWQPELNFLLTIIQIVVGAAAVYHIVRKAVESHKKSKHEKNHPPAPDSP